MDAILCHCRVNPDGHELGSVLDCEAPTIRRRNYYRPEIARYGHTSPTSATGTCPECGRTRVRVTRREIRTADRPDLHDLMPGVIVAVRPALAEHKVAGAVCPGSGAVPAQTRYRSIALEKMIRDFGPESVV